MTEDAQTIGRLFSSLAADWNDGDSEAFAALFVEDGDCATRQIANEFLSP